ncbi:MAG: FG-GAP-like repeat-containing protein [Planctomycetota bacterium]|jgi:hypothetical protein
MAAKLKEIADTANPGVNYTVGWEMRVKYYRSLGDGAKDTSAKLRASMLAGIELLRAGETTEALKELEAVRRTFEQPDVRPSQRSLQSLGVVMATAYLRLAEQENCIARCSSGSCLFPIGEGGIHHEQRGARMAIKELQALLEMDPDDLASKWLLALAYMVVGEYPDQVPAKWRIPLTTFESEDDIPVFENVASTAGVNVLGLSGGSVMEDFDRDGHVDLMMTGWGLREQMRYFRNNGDGSFVDLTEEAGLIGELGGLNMTHADYDNDGDADVLILRGAWLAEHGRHPNSLLRNNGDGTFVDVTEEAGLLSFHPTQTAAWGDFDNDGWLDVFIGNESTDRATFACELYRNNGDGTFTDVAEEVALAGSGFVKGSGWGDFDNDGLIDLYVSRMEQPNILYRNEGEKDGRWRFRDVTSAAGVAEPLRSFPMWWWDYDNDGWLDLFVAGFPGLTGNSLPDIAADYLGLPNAAPTPRLYRNRGDGTFEDMTEKANLSDGMLAMGANYGDIDNDGFLDAYLGTGEPALRTLVPNRMYRNNGSGKFLNVTTSGGFGHLQKGHGISFGDIDNDGDQDVFAVMGGAYTGDVAYNALFLNPGFGHHWITLRLEGREANKAGIGARIKITVRRGTGARAIYVCAGTGGSFGSSTLQQEIGLGDADSIEAIEIRWPGSTKPDVFRQVAMDGAYIARQGAGALEVLPLKAVSPSS